ncbi:hypothetical protein ACFY7H_31870 [Streptomyces sp. NPDC012794]|uniref:hypothetical protein n=1 Tax=Streptomyces sp. NPDC012794 TaxID=3364850 RepID=UPI0036D1062F
MRFPFVHGTGVRARRDALFGLVRERLAGRFPGAEAESCFWGERFGAGPGAGGARAVPGTAVEADGGGETAEWGLLPADPLCELRVLAEAGWGEEEGGGPFAMPGSRPAGERVPELVHRLAEAVPDPEPPTSCGPCSTAPASPPRSVPRRRPPPAPPKRPAPRPAPPPNRRPASRQPPSPGFHGRVTFTGVTLARPLGLPGGWTAAGTDGVGEITSPAPEEPGDH